jgi:hypothetical protein
MPPFVIPPLLKIAVGVLGAGAIVTWVVREVRRINAELDHMKAAPVLDKRARQALPTLRRDPRTDEWRVR